LDVDLPLEICAFFDTHTLSGNVAYRNRRLTQFCALTGVDVSLQLALYGYTFRVYVGFHLPIRTYGEAITAQFDCALDLSVNVEVFAAGEFSLNDDRFADMRKFAGLWCVHETGLPDWVVAYAATSWKHDYIPEVLSTQSA